MALGSAESRRRRERERVEAQRGKEQRKQARLARLNQLQREFEARLDSLTPAESSRAIMRMEAFAVAWRLARSDADEGPGDLEEYAHALSRIMAGLPARPERVARAPRETLSIRGGAPRRGPRR